MKLALHSMAKTKCQLFLSAIFLNRSEDKPDLLVGSNGNIA
jgi:hypothetical protein